MKKTLMSLSAAALLTSCGAEEAGIKLFPESAFTTTVEGKAVSLYTLRAGDLVMQVTNYGARVVSLWTPDRKGKYEDIVLGYDSISRYVDNKGERFLGAAVGPYANRIAKGKFTIDGKEYTLPTNSNGQTLHGGIYGLDRVVWDVVSATENELILSYLHPDGQDGFPANLDIRMTYTLTPENEFCVKYKATTDNNTVVNLSHHSFFNLKGEGNGTVTDNILTINSSTITPVDSALIPTGRLDDVTGTPFDFREPHIIGERIDQDNEQLKNGSGYDHNWVIDGAIEGQAKHVATLYEPTGGRTMEVWSDQPGIQFYSGNFFEGKFNGKYGKPLRYRESLALETQKFPDSPNHPNFPSTLLTPGQSYTQICIYKFGYK